MYGWRKTIGVIVPSVNTVIETDFHSMAKRGINVCVTRILQTGNGKEIALKMNSYVGDAAKILATARPDAVVYGCTAGGVLEGSKYSSSLVNTIGPIVKCPTFTVFDAIIGALRYLSVSNVLLVTPYSQDIHVLVCHAVEEAGVAVTTSANMGIDVPFEIGRVCSETIYGLVSRMKAKAGNKGQAIVISCTNFPALPVIAQLERDLNMPVITSNQAAYWMAMRELGLGTEDLERYGVLFLRQKGETQCST